MVLSLLALWIRIQHHRRHLEHTALEATICLDPA